MVYINEMDATPLEIEKFKNNEIESQNMIAKDMPKNFSVSIDTDLHNCPA